jgi:RNA polymerase sigma-70 factor (ECF subfamily)
MHEEREQVRDDGAIVAALVDRQLDFVAFLERRLGERALAEDILQDALERSLDKVGTLRSPAAAIPWFYRVLRNAVIDHARHAASRDRALSALAAERASDLTEEDADHESCRCVGGVVASLEQDYQTILRCVDVEGVPVKAYASETGITSNNAGVRVFRAPLREGVRATCGACAERGCVDCTCGSGE